MGESTQRAASIAFLGLIATLPWSIAPMSIAVVLCGVLTLISVASGGRWVRTPVDLPAIGWLAALIIVSLASPSQQGFQRVTKGLLLAIVPVAAYHGRSPVLIRRAMIVLLVSALLATIYALVAFAAKGGAFPVRVRGAVGHPLTYGGQAMLLALVSGALLLRARARRWRIAAGVLLALLIPALLGSYTRSAWIGTLAGFTVLLALVRARWILGLVALTVLLTLLLPPGYRARATSVLDPKSHWNVERILLWDAGWRIFRDHPLTGVGLQDLRPWVARYRSPEAHEPPHGHLHSNVLQVAASMGIVGLVAFSALVVGLYRTAGGGLRNRSEADDWLGLAVRSGAVAALTAFLVAGLFEWNFGDEELLDLLLTLVGMAYAARIWGRPSPDAPRSS